ncbi:tripartite tricarboxylate transporter substrate-binding protein [Siccirubricoccus deserti]
MLIGTAPMLVNVHRSRSWRSLPAVIESARARPDAITFGTTGSGTLAHLAFSLVQQVGGFSLTHVPYRGGGRGNRPFRRHPDHLQCALCQRHTDPDRADRAHAVAALHRGADPGGKRHPWCRRTCLRGLVGPASRQRCWRGWKQRCGRRCRFPWCANGLLSSAWISTRLGQRSSRHSSPSRWRSGGGAREGEPSGSARFSRGARPGPP